MAKKTIDLKSITVALGREYPFGDIKKAMVKGREKNISVLTMTEFTAKDDELIAKQTNPTVYDEISFCCGLTKEEALQLARADAFILQGAMNSFLYESEEIILID